MPFDAVAMKAMASFIREKITQELRCLQIVFACWGPNQAHNLTNIFHTNAFSNMLLQGSSATVLQCSLLPSYTGAVFNSSGARLRELCQQGGTKLSQGDFLLVWRVMLAHYPWKLVIYLCCIIRVIVFYTLYCIIITPLPTYLPCYLLHMKAGPRLPTSGDSNYFGSDPKLPKFKQTQACHWNKFGSKCAFGADMSSKTSAPGTSCSKETVLRIGFMNHHRDCWAQKNICEHQNEAERLACALLHVFAEKGLWQGRLEGQGFRRLAPIRMPAFISLATLRALSDKSLAKHSTALRKNHWSCGVHQECLRDAREKHDGWALASG